MRKIPNIISKLPEQIYKTINIFRGRMDIWSNNLIEFQGEEENSIRGLTITENNKYDSIIKSKLNKIQMQKYNMVDGIYEMRMEHVDDIV
jgi:hypothetical protein